MTTFKRKRCSHCQSPYLYQGSGVGCDHPQNNARYCPSCADVVRVALSTVAIRFECRYFPVSEVPEYADVTRADIEAWEADLAARREQGLVGQRIWPALFDLNNGDAQSIREVWASSGRHQGIRFRVSSWRMSPEYLIEIGLEWDLLEQRRGEPWP